MEVSACGLCQLQIPPNYAQQNEMPAFLAQVDSLKLTSKRLCKSCHQLIVQIEVFAAHYQIKYCDSHFKSTAADSLRVIVPQPRPAVHLLYLSSAGGQTQRTRAESDLKNSLLSKRLSCG